MNFILNPAPWKKPSSQKAASKTFEPGAVFGEVTLVEFKRRQYPSGAQRYMWQGRCSCGKIVWKDERQLHDKSMCAECYNKKQMDERKKHKIYKTLRIKD